MHQPLNFSTIPKFVFLERSLHDKDELNEEERYLIMHVPSSTIVEVLHFSQKTSTANYPLNHDFVYKEKEQISFSIHSTLIYKSESAEMKKIFKAMEKWYIDHLEAATLKGKT